MQQLLETETHCGLVVEFDEVVDAAAAAAAAVTVGTVTHLQWRVLVHVLMLWLWLQASPRFVMLHDPDHSPG